MLYNAVIYREKLLKLKKSRKNIIENIQCQQLIKVADTEIVQLYSALTLYFIFIPYFLQLFIHLNKSYGTLIINQY